MKKIEIAGITRGNQFSPNHIGNDAAIFERTAHHLIRKGCEVHTYTENYLLEQDIPEKRIFNMVRDLRIVSKLQAYEDKGCKVVNSGFGIENCTREKMTRLLTDNKISHPHSLILSTEEDPGKALEEAGLEHCWIKRGDFHAIHREDVTYVRNRCEAHSILKEYAMRGIKTAVINEHLAGDLVKFYGVTGTDFFYWFYPTSKNHSKFGWEQINGNARGITFDKDQLHLLCNRTAAILNVHIYGGDCIVSEEGEIRLIDFNDWPSFAPCREEAAPFIASRIFELTCE